MPRRLTKLPKIISIDAFNTLFIARKPVLKQYVEYSALQGITITEQELSSKFPKVFKEVRDKYPNYGKYSGISYIDWWGILIKKLYQPLDLQESFVNGLIHWFSSKDSYSSYPDVLKYLSKRRDDDIVVCLSNGDPRVNSILESLGVSQFLNEVYLSYDIDLKKPSKQFFDYVIDDLISKYGLETFKREDILKQSWHIGDEIQNDLNGSFEAGWNGILVDRTSHLEEIKDLLLKGDEESITKIKIIADLENTTGSRVDSVVKLDERKYVVNSFNRLDEII